MDETILQAIASQLRKPDGAMGLETGVQMNNSNKYQNLFAIESLDVQPNDAILEVGMGNGEFVANILAAGPSVRYTGFDYSDLMIAESAKRNKEFMEAGQAQFIFGTADELPFADESFDKILTVNTIYFWDPVKELAELRRVLKSGGTLVVGIRAREIMQNFPFTQYGFTLYSADELRQTLEQQGFAVTSLTRRQEPQVQVDDRVVSLETVIARATPRR